MTSISLVFLLLHRYHNRRYPEDDSKQCGSVTGLQSPTSLKIKTPSCGFLHMGQIDRVVILIFRISHQEVFWKLGAVKSKSLAYKMHVKEFIL